MNKQVTFGNILTILAIIIIPLFLWGVNVERRFEQTINNTEDIQSLQIQGRDMKDLIQKNQIEVIEGISELKVLIEKNKP